MQNGMSEEGGQQPAQSTAEGAECGSISRRAVFGAVAGGALLTAGGVLPADAARPTPFLDYLLDLLTRLRNDLRGVGPIRRSTDVAILQFALQLEYLEAEFYSYATRGTGIAASLTTGAGEQGPTTGGASVPFESPVTQNTAEELYQDEVAHVRFLRRTLTRLGVTPVAKPAINLGALGLGFGNENEFLILSRAFEDTGVSAYAGAAPMIDNTEILGAAGRILATEAYHAGNIRLQVVQRTAIGVVPELDEKDQAPTIENFFPTDGNGLAVARTMEEVIAIVSPFFPAGLNGLSAQRFARIRRSRRK